MKPLRAIGRVYPLTFFGTLTFLGSVALLSSSLSDSSRVGIALSSLGLVVVLLSVAISWAQVPVARSGDFSWSATGCLRAGSGGEAFILRYSGELFPFMRFHVSLAGTLSVAGETVYRVRSDGCVPAGSEGPFGLSVPCGGALALSGRFMVGDILGLARVEVRDAGRLETAVLPPDSADLGLSLDRTSMEDDDRAAHKAAGFERVLVREYVPGDLVRDINWKALARIGTLITRIPPESPRESPTVRLAVFMPQRGATRSARFRATCEGACVALLAASFVRAVRSLYPDCSLLASVNGEDRYVSGEDDPDTLLSALALAGFSPDGADDIPAIPRGAWVIGSRSDARLARRESSLKATGSGLLLSRFAGFMFRAQDRAALVLPTLSAFPPSAFVRAIGAMAACAGFGDKGSRPSSRSAPSDDVDGVAVFECGVAP